MTALDREIAGRDLGRHALRRARDLLAGAVVEGDDQDELVVVPGQLLGLLEQAADVGIEIVALADDRARARRCGAARRGRCG